MKPSFQVQRYCLLLLISVLLTLACISPTVEIDPSRPIQVSVLITHPNLTISESISVPYGAPALSAFSQVAQLETRDSNYATYIKSVNGIGEQPLSNLYWQFYTDDTFAILAPSDYQLTSPEKIELRFQEMPRYGSQ